eukprot:NODE_290_length_10614_cov_1.553590.p2 type:complete len:389 gc:universal NODE_290_length_10614_cov_1.553590:1454-2620(+)
MSSPNKLQPDLTTLEEQELYAELIQIYNQLKHDSANIDHLLNQFYSLYTKFTELPKGDLSNSRLLLQVNSLDKLFDTCQSLILDILSVQDKISSELLPVFNHLLAMEQKLEYFICSSSFLLEEIEQIQKRLHKIEEKHVVNGCFMISNIDDGQIKKGQALLMGKLNRCYQLAHKALLITENISENLMPIYEELVEIHKSLKSDISPGLLLKLKNRLNTIDSRRVNGIFLHQGEISQGQAILTNLLEECYDIMYEKESTELQDLDESSKIATSLLPIYNELRELLGKLNNILKNERWLIRPSDMIPYQSQLVNIENRGINHVFYGPESTTEIPKGQAVLHHLLHKCHLIIYKLITDLDPIMDPELQHVHSQLLAVRKCLLEMKKFSDYT